MQRSTLTALVVLATAACGPAGSGDGAVEDGSVDADGALTVTSVAPTTVLKPATTLGTVTTTNATATLTRAPTKVDACASYDAITAAIGSRTIECLGTIGPDTFFLDDKGRLRPNFKECTQESQSIDKNVFGDIEAMLTIQERTKDSPDALRCIADRYRIWQQNFIKTEIRNCPVWKKVETLTPPTAANVDAVVKRQPKLPVPRGTTVAAPHENYVMELHFPDGKRDQRCKDEADCARQCSAGFAGLWIKGEGTKAVIDPTYWWISIDFTGVNPFMRADYYHPMSFYGTIPGALYGHRHREGEACSRFVLDDHVLLSLQLDCLDDSVPTSCVTVCAEPVIDTAGTENQSRF